MSSPGSKSRFKPRPRAKPRPAPRPKAKPKPKPKVKEEPQPSKRIKREGPIRSSSSTRSSSSANRRSLSRGRVARGIKKEPGVTIKKEEPEEGEEKGRRELKEPVRVKVEDKESEEEAAVEVEEREASVKSDDAEEEEKEWAQVQELWQLEDDHLAPLAMPFVPENYRRINRDLSSIFPQKAQADEAETLEQPKTVLVQLPRHLPFKLPKAAGLKGMEVKDEPGQDMKEDKVKEEPAGAGSGRLNNKQEALPSGRIGKLRVHASGRTTLLLGENLFELNPGYNCSFQEELCAIQEKSKTLVSLSNLDGRVVCVPNIDHALKECKLAKGNEPVKPTTRTVNV